MHRRVVAIALVAATAGAASADQSWRQPGPPWFGSGEGRKLYDVAASLKLGCPADDTAAKRQQLAQATATLSAAQDAKVRETMVQFAKDTQTWFDTYAAGVPSAGTWPELVRRRVVGRQHLCRLHAAPLQEAMLWTEQFRQHWEARFQALDSLLDEMKSAEKPRSRRR